MSRRTIRSLIVVMLLWVAGFFVYTMTRPPGPYTKDEQGAIMATFIVLPVMTILFSEITA